MAASLAAAARRAGLDREDLAVVERVHACAMMPRVAALEDDHHPAYLHPGRTALILLQDVGPVDPGVLVVAMLIESMDEELRPSRGAVVEALAGEDRAGVARAGESRAGEARAGEAGAGETLVGEVRGGDASTGTAFGGRAIFGVLASIPMPGEEDVAERLLLLDRGVALAALAERLDHLRHLHMRPDRVDGWADTHAEVTDTWLPFAHRIHAQLARRFAHWERVFAKRI